MNITRIEVWFSNELFRAFPEVRPETLRNDDPYVITFQFKGGHLAEINKSNVNFIEYMEEK